MASVVMVESGANVWTMKNGLFTDLSTSDLT